MMAATEELAPTKPWQERPLVDLPCKLPSRTREHLVKLGIDTAGKLSEALDDGRDIGLGDLAERCRGAIEDVRAAEDPEEDEDEGDGLEDTPIHVPPGSGSDGASETIGQSVNRIIDALPSTNGHGEKVQAGKLPDAIEARGKIIAANDDCDEAERVFLVANERAKEAKKEFESAKANLRKVVTWSNTPIVPPKPDLFTGVKESADDQPHAPAIEASAVPKEIEDCWRAFPLARFEQFGLPASLIETLGGQGIATVGQLADYTKPNASGYAQRLVDLKGVGPAKVQKIEEGTTAFWGWWPNHREEFAREMGLLNETPDASEVASSSDGVEADPSEAAARRGADTFFADAPTDPEPKHAGGKRGKRKKK